MKTTAPENLPARSRHNPARRTLRLAAVLLAWAAGTAVSQAQALPVLNGSFESPGVPAGFPALTTVTSWQKAPVPPGFPADQWDQLAGIFPNAAAGDPRHITNADGNQVAFLFAVQGVSLSQQLSSTFDVGVAYNVSVGLRGGGALTAGSTFQVGLYYLNGSTPVTFAATVATATPEFTTTSQLFNVQLNLQPVQAGDAWAGKPIGLELTASSHNGAPGIAYWEVDKVSVTAVPEPGTYALLACGGLGWLGVAAWRRLLGSR